MTPEIQAQLHSLLLTVLTGVVTIVGILIRNLINAQIANIKNEGQKAMAQRLVAYAEQKLSNNVEKNSYVANQLSSKFPELSKDEIQHLLEEAVVSLQSTAPAAVTNGATK